MASRRSARHANVYDAVAGRVTLDAVRLDEPSPTPADRPPRLRSSSVAGTPALAPEEALFRPESAPERYAERDVYMAHERDLPALPDSDLLKAVHLYSSHFYAALRRSDRASGAGPRARGGTRGIDENSMDETALIAFGILLEEAGREALGRRGDLVFTEPQDASSTGDNDEPEDDPTAGTDAQADLDPASQAPASRSRRSSMASFTSSLSTRRRKRPRMADD